MTLLFLVILHFLLMRNCKHIKRITNKLMTFHVNSQYNVFTKFPDFNLSIMQILNKLNLVFKLYANVNKLVDTSSISTFVNHFSLFCIADIRWKSIKLTSSGTGYFGCWKSTALSTMKESSLFFILLTTPEKVGKNQKLSNQLSTV